MKLERISPPPGPQGPNPNMKVENGELPIVDEEEELRNWADLREYQIKWAQSGGFLDS
jgi:hypothetical protein